MPALHKRTEKEGTLPVSFYMGSITLIPKPNKDVKRKKTYTNLFSEYRYKNSKPVQFRNNEKYSSSQPN